jgi:DNA-binding beta-propeller fold protein YncE
MARGFRRRPTRSTIAGCVVLSVALCGTAYGAVDVSSPGAREASVSPANKIYWGNNTTSTVVEANADGSGGGSEVGTTGTTVTNPTGTAIDPATNKIYWTSAGSNEISVANLDGTGGASNLYTAAAPGGATVSTPVGVVIDPAANKIYWANLGDNTIAVANLDGTGGGRDLYTAASPGGATVNAPQGVTIDPAANKIYWANVGDNTIAEANLDGTGNGGHLSTTGATAPDSPVGVAIDPAANKIYWANANDTKISEANLDGTGDGSDLSTTGASAPDGASGVAIDPAANKIYWASKFDSTISEANLDGTGHGANLYTAVSPGGASVNGPEFPALLEAPAGNGVPVISGGIASRSMLSCSQGTWASDLIGAFLYRAPESFTYAWTLNGTPLLGATKSSLTASSGGKYACMVTATNLAGSTTQTSATHTVSSPPPSCTLKAEGSRVQPTETKHNRKPSTGKLKLAADCTQAVHGKLTGTVQAVIKRKHGKRQKESFKLTAVSAALGAGKSVTLAVVLPKAAFSALAAGSTESATFALIASNANGSAHASAKIAHLKLNKQKHK